MLAYLIPGIAYGFGAGATPGPLAMYLISQALSVGWRRTLPASFAPLVSDGPVAVLVLTALSQVPISLVQYLRLFGGAFILFLAFGAWKSWRDLNSGNAIIAEASPKRFLKAAAINWLNPYPYLGWSTFLGPMVLNGWRESPLKAIVFILGFYITMIAVTIGIILVFSVARTFGPRVRRSLMGFASVALACLGLYQLWLGSSILRTAS